ncbi:MAG: amidohydrolase family protein [Acidimicrobiales bacterium]
MTPEDLDYQPFDADNHYYEALDAFTRHVPADMQRRIVQWVEQDGRKYHLVGGTISHAVVNPTWDPVALPGALHSYFKGNPDGRSPVEMLKDREPLPAYYMDPAARVKVLEQQGIQAVWLFPTLGVLYEELLKEDVEACALLMQAFNQWLAEDWGFAYENKIFGAPYLCLGDRDAAAAEVDKVVAAARLVVMRPAAVTTPTGVKSPFDPHFDPVWARINEAGITVVIHARRLGLLHAGLRRQPVLGRRDQQGQLRRPEHRQLLHRRAAQDWLIQAVFQKIFDRFPNLRFASVENGSDFLAPMFRKFDQTARKSFGWFTDHPVDTFKEKVWMNPFWEDDVNEVAELMGPDHVIFGSDWPHIEGLPSPLDYLVELKEFDDVDRKKILLDNVTFLNTPQPL